LVWEFGSWSLERRSGMRSMSPSGRISVMVHLLSIRKTQTRRNIINRNWRRHFARTASHPRRRAAATALLLIILLQRQSLVRCIGKRSRHYQNWTSSHQRAHHPAANDLSLASSKIDGESGGTGRGWSGEKRAGEGEDVEAAVESHDGPGGRGLAESDVDDGPAAAENGHAALAPARELGHAVSDVGAAGYLHDVASQRVRAVSRDEYWRFGLVLGTWWTTPRAARGSHVNSSFFGLVAVFFLLFFFPRRVPSHRTLVHRKPQIRFSHRVTRVLQTHRPGPPPVGHDSNQERWTDLNWSNKKVKYLYRSERGEWYSIVFGWVNREKQKKKREGRRRWRMRCD